MTVPGNLSSPLLATAAAGAAGPVATRSLRFNLADTANLQRTPSSAGNRTTWTLSFWVKRGKLSAGTDGQEIFNTGTAANNYFGFRFNDSECLEIFDRPTSGNVGQLTTTQVFRDCSAWYHIVYTWDTTNSTQNDRRRLYVNGSRVTDFSTNTAITTSGTESRWNSTLIHTIGKFNPNNAIPFDGYLADIYHVDGVSLEPTSFGAYDDNGVWQAAAYSGTFGTNGFHLKFDDVSSAAALGTDSSGNSNTFTVNNLVHAGGVAGAGARSAAVLFDGTDDSISFTNNSDLNPGSGNFTLECFVYKQPGQQVVVYYGTGVGQVGFRVLGNSKLGVERINTAFDLQTGNTVPENQWVHVAWARSGTTLKGFINGQEAGSATTSQNYSGTFITAKTLNDFNNMVISDLHLVKGTALYTSSFTAPTTISAHSDTKLLCFQNASSATTATTKPSGVTLTASSSPTAGPYPMTADADVDALFDAPTNGDASSDTGAGGELSSNYATLNPLHAATDVVFANGNLDVTWTTGNGSTAYSTIAISSGKFYWEYTVSGTTSIGIYKAKVAAGNWPGINSDSYGYAPNGQIVHNSSYSSYGTAHSSGDVIGVAFDADNGKLYFSLNGTWQNSSNPANGTNPAFSSLDTEISWYAAIGYWSGGTVNSANFGQREFNTAAPSGYKCLNVANLPTPTIADGSKQFNIKLWTGTGSSQAITGYGFSPDFAWIKSRSNTASHALLDTVRGNSNVLRSDNANAEVANNTSVWTSFDSDGFTLGADNNNGWTNWNTWTYVGWAWNSASSTASNTDGSITSSVRANQTAGFSIVKWTGTASAGTVGHGLGAKPDLLIVKNYGESADWMVWHSAFGSAGSGQHLSLNTTDSKGSPTSRALWNSDLPTISVFSVGSDGHVNSSGKNIVAYCFASVAGYSAFGTYEGTGSSSTAPFVYTGMRPRWIMFKNMDFSDSSTDWVIYDTTRTPFNGVDDALFPNRGVAEANETSHVFDILSNGFKVRSTSTSGLSNKSGNTYIWGAFASHPFQANGGLAR